MIKEEFTARNLMLFSEINRCVVRDVTDQEITSFWGHFKLYSALSDGELYDLSKIRLAVHFQLAIDGPVTNPHTRAFVIAVSTILDSYEGGFGFYEEMRFLLRSYIALSRMGYLGRD